MAVREILRMGNPALLRPSDPVEDPTAPAIRDIVQDMRDTLEHVSGIGLAAPQIAVPLRIVLYCLPENRIPPGAKARPIPWTAMINPAIEPVGEEIDTLWERCLSLPGLYARVPRFRHIVIRYRRLDGSAVTERWSGYVATLLQHECDHLDGVLYPMRMTDAAGLAYASEVCGNGTVYSYSPEEFDGLAA